MELKIANSRTKSPLEVRPQLGQKTAGAEPKPGRIPPGPHEPCRATDNLLEWIGRHFETFGDIYKASIDETSVYVIRDIEFAYHVLVRNWQNYVKGHLVGRVALLCGDGLVASEGDLWKRQRRMIQPVFHRESVPVWTEMITAVNAELLKKWQLAAQRNETVNVTHDVSRMVLEVTLRFLFGEDYERVRRHFDLLSEEHVRNMAFARSFQALKKITHDVIDRRGRAPAKAADALGMFMEARDPESGQPMEERQLIDEVLTVVVAGHETTANTLNWTWYLLSQHPEAEEKLANELNMTTFSRFDHLSKFVYTRQVIDEAMRLYPALWLPFRKALRDDWLGEYFVPAGTEIYIPLYFLQRHPDVWEQPDRFDPDRFQPDNSKHRHRLATMPFAAGPRNCIGEHLARLEMQIHLLTIGKSLRLRYVQSKPIELEVGVNLRSKDDFIMYPEVR
jgi:cytochrome P450